MKAIIKTIRKNHEEISVINFTKEIEIEMDNDQLEEYVNETFGYCYICGYIFYKSNLHELTKHDDIMRYICSGCMGG